MIVEAGHYALTLSLALAIIQATLPFWGARRGDLSLMRVGDSAAIAQFLFVSFAFAALATAHLTSDFSVKNVTENSHSAMPAIYKFSGLWGNHEGSMLLWSLILAVFGAIVAVFGQSLPARLRADALTVQGLLAIHPPLLYLGYVGFSIVFSFAAAALIEGRIDAAWARFVRPFSLIAWGFLTLGIAMGSYWAYYTLGWGGFWFWDPVENASLMPFLAGTAFIHSVAVMEKRDALKVWTIFLAILAFSLSLLGTFLVRSGVLTSVHAFASDPTRGVVILAILAFFIIGSLSLFAWRAPMLKQGGLFAPISREGALVLNNLLLTTSCATVLFGTLYPLALEQFTGQKITVGAPFFNMTCGVLLLTLSFATPFGFALAWKRGDLLGVVQRLAIALLGGLAVFVALAAIFHGGPVVAPIAAGIAVLVMLGTVSEVAARIGRGGVKASAALARARGLPLSFWGGAAAHFGAGVALLGLAATGFGAEAIVSMRQGEPVQVGPYRVVLDSVSVQGGPNFHEQVAKMTIRDSGGAVAEVEPARRQFTARQMTTTQAGIATIGLGQLYVSIADPDGSGLVPARLYWKPLLTLIWLGACCMALGGALSLADRRLRFGAPARASARAASEAGVHG
jgi:cytochrome c-type biogenesis protein CcmF